MSSSAGMKRLEVAPSLPDTVVGSIAERLWRTTRGTLLGVSSVHFGFASFATKTGPRGDSGASEHVRTADITRAIAADTLMRFQQAVVPQLDAAYNFARFLSRDADAAQDIVQNAFLKAYRGFDGYRGGDARAWIFAIVRNCYRDWLLERRRKAQAEVDPIRQGDFGDFAETVASEDDTPETTLLRKAEAERVRWILTMIPRPLREVLVLRELEDLSYRQIADVTSVPIGTVMSRLARARKEFGDAWRREIDSRETGL